MRSAEFAMACALLLSAQLAEAELEPKSRNTVVFVESAQKGHEWEAYRLCEDRRPVVFDASGPGRILLTLRTFVRARAEAAVAVVLIDDRIILTATVEPNADVSAKFPDEEKIAPSQVGLYLVRVPSGAHKISVRYSGGAPTLVLGKLSATETIEANEGDELPLEMPKIPRDEPDVNDESTPLEQPELPEGEPAIDELDEPTTGPEHEVGLAPGREPGPRLETETSEERALTVLAPWLMVEIRAGAQVDRLGFAVAPTIGLDARLPVPGLDARSFTIGLAADVAYARAESEVRASGGAIVGTGEFRHAVFTAALDLRWVYLRDRIIEPYFTLGGGALIGSMSSKVDGEGLTARSLGGFGTLALGAALGGSGHRPHLEARMQAGLLSSDLLADGKSAYVAFALMIGFRFEFLTEIPVSP